MDVKCKNHNKSAILNFFPAIFELVRELRPPWEYMEKQAHAAQLSNYEAYLLTHHF